MPEIVKANPSQPGDLANPDPGLAEIDKVLSLPFTADDVWIFGNPWQRREDCYSRGRQIDWTPAGFRSGAT